MQVKVQLLLKPAFRNPADMARAVKAAEAHGIRVTETGAATISGELQDDFATGPFASSSAGALPIPPALHDLIEGITVAPRHLPLKE